MDALTYLKEKARMTERCSIPCDKCYFGKLVKNKTCVAFEYDNPEKAIEIVEKWVKENPVWTYKRDFFEKFPNARKDSNGYPIMWVEAVYGGNAAYKNMFEAWDEEYQDPRP